MKKVLSPETTKVLKNMVIAILTSVAGAIIIYFLGFNKKKPTLTPLDRKEITVDAWKTYVTVENIYIQNTISILQDGLLYQGFGDQVIELAAESKKFQNSLEDVLGMDGVDKEVVTFLNQRLKADKTHWQETEKFYKGFETGKADWTVAPLKDTLKARFNRFMQQTKIRFTQFAPDIEKLSGKLIEKYDQPFVVNDLLIIQATKYKKEIFILVTPEVKNESNLPPDESVSRGKDAGSEGKSPGNDEATKVNKQYLTGQWDAGSGITIIMEANGKLNWLIAPDNKEARGTWQLKNNQIVMNITHHPITGKTAKWIFNLSNVLTNSFTIILDGASAKMYNMVRK